MSLYFHKIPMFFIAPMIFAGCTRLITYAVAGGGICSTGASAATGTVLLMSMLISTAYART
ncbi:hypothetical protein ACFSKY_05440 [Azotobacter chroococcum]|jgi:hypothetical protein|uniref:hypothetical protein n=1 Tax=Azotobacter chroococcum TaxID=353 RepID=UPI001038C8DB|nr:hypothetical protein [Azotobacter chroococcum]TBV94061.1 hypothetical protein E0E53_15640 [Azotobacter chroococcum]TBW01784.1 hypothetical protein E0E52_19000 [Azotobacter chroococcum]